MFERIILTQINPHVYLMDDHHEATGYIVVGSKKALVIDTMNGYEDVRAVVRTVTDLPIMVVNTHGHVSDQRGRCNSAWTRQRNR